LDAANGSGGVLRHDARMLASVAATAVLVIHGLFILFVVTGGLLALWRPWVAVPHLLAAAWGAAISFGGWICPLTPLENHFRQQAGLAGYQGGFIEHYLLALIYPDGLTRGVQIGLGMGVIALNVIVYGWVWRRRDRR
jgi:hypothetical protein